MVRRTNPCGGDIFRIRTERTWVAPTLLYDGHRVFPVNATSLPERGVDHPHLGSGQTDSGLPRRAVISARGGKAFEIYYVRLHHSRHTEGGLTRRMSARLLIDGNDAVLRKTVRRSSRRGSPLSVWPDS